ncbi:NAD-dependent epimerase/dehydratase family protein [candidate division WOR-3 bacterium]|uniref:NAD-dependent epimerase/dehydratase family protein n=1 Tax=candidate division WOR-3 bacterium TaxID=2052148 RepID=A0A9D5K9T4_UNCW3|nr:NAD-dependent epimerase/dehydratase family protein [candidate division WOR-3 bacterium]MBD3365041.1 NAD-dependent epimerase/dehydratase family protein [candidate division WOR-3 bacterium]
MGERMKTYLVTGGAGFIGSLLCRSLAGKGNKVICMDSLVTGQKNNVSDLEGNPRFTFVEEDVRKVDLGNFKVDGVYHLAAICGVPRVEQKPLKIILNILEGTQRVLAWAAEKKIRVLFVSSSEIYGNPQVHPQPERYWGYTNPLGPRSPYVEAKRAGEALCRAYRIEKGLEISIARLFNVYGPGFRKDDPRVIPRFIQAALADEPLNLYGTGEATRSFCYVDDIVEGLVSLMDSGASDPVNLGYPEETEIRELAKVILRITDSQSEINFLPAICEDPLRRLPDISRAKGLLKWEPNTTLEDGLRKTFEWIEEFISQGSLSTDESKS